MTPGATIVKRCPGCTRLLKFSTIASGNTFGATWWTDGKCEAPMLPDNPWLQMSPSEGVLFWQDECEEVGQMSPWEESKQSEWADLEYADEPAEHDYQRALAAGMAPTAEKQRYLRMRLWWAANDRLRSGSLERTPEFWTEQVVSNLKAIAELLDGEDADARLMRAEVFRELGEFDLAASTLTTSFPQEFMPAVQTIRRLVEQSDRYVRQIQSD